MECAAASVVETHGVEVVHMRGKGVLYPPGTHDF